MNKEIKAMSKKKTPSNQLENLYAAGFKDAFITTVKI